MVPLSTLMSVEEINAPDKIMHYNLYPSADINGATLPGVSSGDAIRKMEAAAKGTLSKQFGYEWTELSLQEVLAGDTALFIFPLCVLFVFLALSAQYESWSLPLTIILIVPMCLLSALVGIYVRNLDNNIFTQIAFVVLVGLACKNAILIVEFAKQQSDAGKPRAEAALEAARLRLRPILMTSFAFILGVVPLVIATGAGAEMRQVLGTAVFSGMIGVTLFGIFLTPVFYVGDPVVQRAQGRRRRDEVGGRRARRGGQEGGGRGAGATGGDADDQAARGGKERAAARATAGGRAVEEEGCGLWVVGCGLWVVRDSGQSGEVKLRSVGGVSKWNLGTRG